MPVIHRDVRGGTQRDLLPLPVPQPPVGPAAGRCCRAVRRRALRSAHWRSWLADGVQALNELEGGGEWRARLDSAPSEAQGQALHRLSECYRAAPAPPSDLDPRGAWNALQGGSPTYAGVGAPKVAGFRRGCVSLPQSGHRPVPLVDCLGVRDRELLELRDSRLWRGQSDAQKTRKELGLRAGYFDTRLRSHPAEYGELLLQLEAANMVEFVPASAAKSTCGLFFVPKKTAGRLRLIIDTRLANTEFAVPDDVDLATVSALTDLELEPGEKGWLGQGDLENCFHFFELPASWKTQFVLPPVAARHLGKTRLGSLPLAPCTQLRPVIRTVPMGWSWAVYFVQQAHEFLVDRALSLPPEVRVREGLMRKPLGAQECAHVAYLDNFGVLGPSKSQVELVVEQVAEVFRGHGLAVHEMDPGSLQADFLGLRWDGERGRFTLSQKRLWRIRMGIDFLLAKGRCSGKELERVIGHVTFACLTRRECLSMLSSVYAYSRQLGLARGSLWPSVRRELFWVRSLLPLIFSDVHMEWDACLTASDASPWGWGAGERMLPTATVAQLGRVRERWRFLARRFEAHAPREHALAAPQELQPQGLAPADFPEVSEEVTREDRWNIVGAFRFHTKEHITALEGRAAVWSLRRRLRRVGAQGRRCVHLVDNLGLAFVLSKGRSSRAALRGICRQWCALSLAGQLRPSVRWIASERNPTDGASRLYMPAHLRQLKDSPGSPARPPAPHELQAAWEAGGPAGGPSPGRASAGAEGGAEAPKGMAGCASQGAVGHAGGGGTSSSSRSASSGSASSGRFFRRGSSSCSSTSRCRRARRRASSPSRAAGRKVGARALGREGREHLLPRTAVGAPRHPAGVPGPDGDFSELVQGRGDGAGLELQVAVGSLAGELPPVPRFPLLLGGGDRPCHEDLRRDPQAAPPGLGRGGPRARQDGAQGLGSPRAPAEPLPASVGRGSGVRGSPGLPRPSRHGSGACPCLRHVRAAVRDHGSPGLPGGGAAARAREGVLPRGGAAPGAGAGRLLQDRHHGQLGSDRPCGQAGAGAGARGPQAQAGTAGPALPLLAGGVGERRAAGHGGRGRRAPPGHAVLPPSWRGERRRHLRNQAPERGEGARLLAQRPVRPPLPAERSAQRGGGAPQPGAAVLRVPVRGAARGDPRRQLGAALAAARRLSTGRVFLEIFSGCGLLSRCMSDAGWEVVSWDICHGERYNLTDEENVRLIVSWLRSGRLQAIWLAPPCSSFSRARRWDGGPPPLRDAWHVAGRPGLSPTDSEKVAVGNSLCDASAFIATVAARCQVPGGMENPGRSFLWDMPTQRALLLETNVEEHVVDFCQYGTQWQKRTKIVSWHLARAHRMDARCIGRNHYCSKSKKKHIPLTGKHSQGVYWTLVAQPYPLLLCRCLTKLFTDTYMVSKLEESRELCYR